MPATELDYRPYNPLAPTVGACVSVLPGDGGDVTERGHPTVPWPVPDEGYGAYIAAGDAWTQWRRHRMGDGSEYYSERYYNGVCRYWRIR